ncbi:hypothetical protein [Flavisolibacter ginsenosidimutans]|uniref:Uncharacterized protein n=1 Tax=Flavisolibacter ginsenosidimutans TaxID=661481 RepID=A0A5B8UFC6_9BACT|nr:hypothetical protein [Flavisolibacter ginsenosidimutans]QEC54839.1 hypothetical protein FSB75_02625 [Flavisolibacter ginsenosidimutans]
MEASTLSLFVAVLALFIGIVALLRTYREPKKETDGFNTKPLKLQAYERLVILCERISLPALISRTSSPDLSAREMQYMLVGNIKQEFEYNTSQQIYVSQAAWESVRNLRDQTLLIINSIARTLPEDARAHDLNKGLLEAIMNQDNAALHTYTLDTLNGEAKKAM